MAVIRSQGTDLYFIDPATNDLVQVGCPTSIDGISAPVDQVETTCLGDNVRTYISGLKTPGPATFGLQFDTTDPSHIRLNELYNSNVNIQWAIGLSDGTADPTVDTAGEWLLPTSRSFITFEGYVSDYPFTIGLNTVVTSTVSVYFVALDQREIRAQGLNTVVTSTVSVQVSGDRIITPKTTP